MHAGQLYSHLEWDVQPVDPYQNGLCYAVHALLLFHIWMHPQKTTLEEVLRCSPPLPEGGDPGLFFRRCVDLQTFSYLDPGEDDLLSLLLKGPVLVGAQGHAMTLKGFNQSTWFLVDTKNIFRPRQFTFAYALGI